MKNRIPCTIIFLWILAGADFASGDDVKAKPSLPLGDNLEFQTNDVVALLGGADVAAAQQSGQLEALLAVKYLEFGLHFRNFGWEGDTVFEQQPRDVGFPTLKTRLEQARASVIWLQYGRAEALDGSKALLGFKAAYQKLLDECSQQTPRLVLVTPPPFENGGGLLPDLSERNTGLAAYAEAIRELARQRHLALVDLFAEFGGESHREPRLTENGLQLTPRGQALMARAFARQLGFDPLASRAGEPDARGAWPNAAFESVRQAVVAKNRLWFDYWRSQNWAFLGGDRTNQPSSRDHRNPGRRWFPEEHEKFVPLIQQAERRINEAAQVAAQ